MRRAASGIVVGGPFNSGVLARRDGAYDYAAAPAEILVRVERLEAVCRRFGVTLGSAALRFAGAHPAVVSVIPGSQSVAEVAANVAMLNAHRSWPLDGAEGRGSDRSGGADAARGDPDRMLKGVDPILGPELLSTLRAMGHGDDIAIVDANFPATANARRLIRADGISATRMVEAVVSLLPLDDFEDIAAFRMAVVGAPDETPPVIGEFAAILKAPAMTAASRRSSASPSTSTRPARMRSSPPASGATGAT